LAQAVLAQAILAQPSAKHSVHHDAVNYTYS